MHVLHRCLPQYRESDVLAGSPNQGYAAFKQGLAAHLGSDIESYADLKDPVCDIIMAAAEEWAAETGREPGPSTM